MYASTDLEIVTEALLQCKTDALIPETQSWLLSCAKPAHVVADTCWQLCRRVRRGQPEVFGGELLAEQHGRAADSISDHPAALSHLRNQLEGVVPPLHIPLALTLHKARYTSVKGCKRLQPRSPGFSRVFRPVARYGGSGKTGKGCLSAW